MRIALSNKNVNLQRRFIIEPFFQALKQNHFNRKKECVSISVWWKLESKKQERHLTESNKFPQGGRNIITISILLSVVQSHITAEGQLLSQYQLLTEKYTTTKRNDKMRRMMRLEVATEVLNVIQSLDILHFLKPVVLFARKETGAPAAAPSMSTMRYKPECKICKT